MKANTILKAAAGLLMLGVALSACNKGTQVEGTKIFKPVPTPTVTLRVPVPGPTVRVTVPPSVEIRNNVATPPVVVDAFYEVSISCVESGTRRSGATISESPVVQRESATAGAVLKYSFAYSRDDSQSDPIVSWSKACSIKATQIRDGAEPRLAALLGCTGDAQYTQNPPRPATSAIDNSWHDLKDLTNGFTHTMKAPRTADEISESDHCTFSIVAR